MLLQLFSGGPYEGDGSRGFADDYDLLYVHLWYRPLSINTSLSQGLPPPSED